MDPDDAVSVDGRAQSKGGALMHRLQKLMPPVMLALTAAQAAAQACGPLPTGGYGPYDYRYRRDKVGIVEQYHFTPKVEALIAGATGTIGDATWSALRERYADDQLVELVCLIGFYRLAANICRVFAVEPDERIAHLAQRPHRVGKVRDPQIGLALERPGGGFGERPGLGRRMPVRRDHGAGAEHLGRAQDGADIVRVGDPVEQQHQGRVSVRRADLGDRAPIERLDLQSRALMHRLRIERRLEAARIDDLRRKARCTDLGGQPVGGIAGDDEPALDARGVGKRVAHRMQAEEPDCAGPILAPRPFLLDRPGRFLDQMSLAAAPLRASPMQAEGSVERVMGSIVPVSPRRTQARRGSKAP